MPDEEGNVKPTQIWTAAVKGSPLCMIRARAQFASEPQAIVDILMDIDRTVKYNKFLKKIEKVADVDCCCSVSRE